MNDGAYIRGGAYIRNGLSISECGGLIHGGGGAFTLGGKKKINLNLLVVFFASNTRSILHIMKRIKIIFSI